MRTTGLCPPIIRPAAMAMVSPSRHTGTSLNSLAFRASYMKPVSLSGSQTTWVTPHCVNWPNTPWALIAATRSAMDCLLDLDRDGPGAPSALGGSLLREADH